MSVQSDIKPLMPVLVFLVAQSIAGVWWAAKLDTTVRTLTTDVTEFKREQVRAQVRQDDLIKSNALEVNTARGDGRAFQVEMNLLRRSIDNVTNELAQNNRLLLSIQNEVKSDATNK